MTTKPSIGRISAARIFLGKRRIRSIYLGPVLIWKDVESEETYLHSGSFAVGDGFNQRIQYVHNFSMAAGEFTLTGSPMSFQKVYNRRLKPTNMTVDGTDLNVVQGTGLRVPGGDSGLLGHKRMFAGDFFGIIHALSGSQ